MIVVSYLYDIQQWYRFDRAQGRRPSGLQNEAMSVYPSRSQSNPYHLTGFYYDH